MALVISTLVEPLIVQLLMGRCVSVNITTADRLGEHVDRFTGV